MSLRARALAGFAALPLVLMICATPAQARTQAVGPDHSAGTGLQPGLAGPLRAGRSVSLPSRASSSRPQTHARAQPAGTHRLVATITGVSPQLRQGRDLQVSGVVQNLGTETWLDAQVYLQVSPDPARTLQGLNAFAQTPQNEGIGSTIYTFGQFAQVGDIDAHQSKTFSLSVPYASLPISGKPGVYRVGIKVVATAGAVRDLDGAAHDSTLVPLLPRKPENLHAEQTLTLLPITAPVKRLLTGAFSDDSLATSISFGGRLYNLMAWALKAPPGTLQLAVDPALLTALDDMSHGYQVRPPGSSALAVPGRGQTEAVTWLLNFDNLISQQYVMLLPWGTPAANSLLANGLPGPVVSAVRASERYQQANTYATGVAGWLTDGGSGLAAISVMRQAGADLQFVAQSSLPALSAGHRVTRGLPSLVTVHSGSRDVPVIVAATKLAGYPTSPTTTALQVRQRLIADATVRSISDDDQIRVTALPFRWNPGPSGSAAGLDGAFALPVIVGQSAIGVADQTPVPYHGPVRAGPLSVPLTPVVLNAIRALRLVGGPLAAILLPSQPAEAEFEHTLAMAGSYEWRTFPLLGSALINRRAGLARQELDKVTVTGPPFVAMSSTSGRFPLTVTNGLDQDINVRLAVMPEDPALDIGPLGVISVPAGQRRDIQIVGTAEGSGVTSVRARLATPDDVPFGHAWRFDVRATQIGLVIWVVMGIGGTVLFGAAGYRIVNRIRGRGGPSRRRADA